MLFRVCVAVTEGDVVKTIVDGLSDSDAFVYQLDARNDVLTALSRQNCDLFLVGLSVLDHHPREAARLLKSLPESPAVVLMTRDDDAERRAAYLAMGFDAVLNVDLSPTSLIQAIRGIIDARREISEEIAYPHDFSSGPRLSDFVSNSDAMRAFMRTVRKVSRGDTSLLITGETGVGKERLARAIHEESSRQNGPFIPINCAALPGNLLESELFGHERGAFTGATRTRRGAFELGHNGTVFLDEIGDTPLELQVKLLRVLQEREFCRLGGETAIKIDVRIMAATNRDLKHDVDVGDFRQDLYYRLGVINLHIPPLRERREDIEALATSYLRYLRAKIGTNASEISAGALAAMRRYDWPGNVRELINVIERAMLLCEDDVITPSDLPDELAKTSSLGTRAQDGVDGEVALSETELKASWSHVRQERIAILEKAYFSALLTKNGGRIGVTAKQAGLDARSVYQKMRRHGLRKEDFKATSASTRE